MRAVTRLALVAALGVAPTVWAQPEAPPDPQSVAIELKAKLMYMRFDFGLSTVSNSGLFQNGKPMELGFFLGNVDAYFADVPEALELARTAGSHKTLGFAFTLGALALVLTDLVWVTWLAASNNIGTLERQLPLIVGLAGASLALNIAGLVFTVLATNNLMKAVNRFNFGVIDKYLPREQKIDFNMLIGSRMAGVGLKYTF